MIPRSFEYTRPDNQLHAAKGTTCIKIFAPFFNGPLLLSTTIFLGVSALSAALKLPLWNLSRNWVLIQTVKKLFSKIQALKDSRISSTAYNLQILFSLQALFL
jgi:hypothetical protein